MLPRLQVDSAPLVVRSIRSLFGAPGSAIRVSESRTERPRTEPCMQCLPEPIVHSLSYPAPTNGPSQNPLSSEQGIDLPFHAAPRWRHPGWRRAVADGHWRTGAIRLAAGRSNIGQPGRHGDGNGGGHGDERRGSHAGIACRGFRCRHGSVDLRVGDHGAGRNVHGISQVHAGDARSAAGRGGAGGHALRRLR